MAHHKGLIHKSSQQEIGESKSFCCYFAIDQVLFPKKNLQREQILLIMYWTDKFNMLCVEGKESVFFYIILPYLLGEGSWFRKSFGLEN